jgi:hypothetical protein
MPFICIGVDGIGGTGDSLEEAEHSVHRYPVQGAQKIFDMISLRTR